LEYARKNADNIAENTQEAESRIADTDMAAEMVKYAKQSILMQTNESILSQANAMSESVLNLLK
jgi:flagellin